jgi:transcriptional regulator with XRE-family HTH domain
MTPDDLRAQLDASGVSARELARRLHVSPMFVSRRLSGATLITRAEATRILSALRPATTIPGGPGMTRPKDTLEAVQRLGRVLGDDRLAVKLHDALVWGRTEGTTGPGLLAELVVRLEDPEAERLRTAARLSTERFQTTRPEGQTRG